MPKFTHWEGEVDQDGRPITRHNRVDERLDREAPACLLCDRKGKILRDGMCADCRRDLKNGSLP
jgi:hypothetical protein